MATDTDRDCPPRDPKRQRAREKIARKFELLITRDEAKAKADGTQAKDRR